MNRSEFAQAVAWEKSKRIVVIGLLSMSAIQTLAAALILSLVGSGEHNNLIAASLILFGGVAIAVAIAFRKLQQPNWKHWLAVFVLAAPGALSVLLH